jgi:6-phosphogluconate dehydrogenase
VCSEIVFGLRSRSDKRADVLSLSLSYIIYKKSRRILLSIPAGKPVEMTLEALKPLLESDDVIIDGGNEHFSETRRRERMCAVDWEEECGKKIHFVGMGISGGAEGARHGPALMPGGSEFAYNSLKPMLEAMSAKAGEKNDEPCVTRCGPDGCGHYVKMVHNGIEYADMQFIAESVVLLRDVLGYDNEKQSNALREWNDGELESFLIDITAKCLKKKDDDDDADNAGGEYLANKVLDKAGSKGTGKWTVQLAADAGIAIPCCSAALEARYISAAIDDRAKCSETYSNNAEDEILVESTSSSSSSSSLNAETLGKALYCAKIIAYAQGLSLIKSAGDDYGWSKELNIANICKVWRGGCIIRAKLLETIVRAFTKEPSLSNLLLDSEIASIVKSRVGDLRKVVVEAAQRGVASPALMNALSYYDGMRTKRGSAYIIQAQRDAFGAHTFERVDKEGKFHADWW